MEEDDKPWLEKRFGIWEINPGNEREVQVNIGVNQNVIIDKLYGPLCSSDVRIRLEYTNDKADWVVECQNITTEEWEEKARWYCQENWPVPNKKDLTNE